MGLAELVSTAPGEVAVVMLAAYLLGSVPFGYLLTRAAGLGDIRAIGSGNIGATNVLRTGRKGLAAATLVLDAAKAVMAILLAGWLFGPAFMPLAACCAIAGHCFPVWLKFDGGKGVASGLGALIALDWRLGLATAAVWLLVFAITRISSAGAVVATACSPLLALLFLPAAAVFAPIVIAAMVLWRHRANIMRLRAGTEPRVGAQRGASIGAKK